MYPHVWVVNNDRNIWDHPQTLTLNPRKKKKKQDAAEECRKALESYLQGWQLVPWRCIFFMLKNNFVP